MRRIADGEPVNAAKVTKPQVNRETVIKQLPRLGLCIVSLHVYPSPARKPNVYFTCRRSLRTETASLFYAISCIVNTINAVVHWPRDENKPLFVAL
jgi:hypothetical protein